ncbi:MAG TPA: hypothetical protein PLR25_13415 [Planctomycetaceae bacterium]|nr:hypothetical protein [Planctomycetaceae bacterium]
MWYICLQLYVTVSQLLAIEPVESPAHHSFRYHTSYGSPEPMHTMEFSPDSRQLAASVAEHLDVIDLRKGEIVQTVSMKPQSLTFTQDGKRLYAVFYDESRLLELPSGDVIPTKYEAVMAGPGINLEERNGKLLVRSLLKDSSADAGHELKPGDELVAFGESQNGKMKRLTGQSVMDATKVLQGYGGTFVRLTFLPRGRYGAKNEKTIILRRTHATETNQKVAANTYEKCKLPSSLAQCMVGSIRCLEFRNAATGDPVIYLETIDIANVGLNAMSPDQSKFAILGPRMDSNGLAVEVYDLASQKRLAFIPVSSRHLSDITFASDNNSVLVGGWDSIEACDSTTGAIVSRKKLGYQLHKKVSSDPTGESVKQPVMSSVQPQRSVDSPAEKESSHQLVVKLSVSPKNLLASGDSAGNIRVWDLETNKLLASIPGEKDHTVEQLQFSPDGQWLAYYVGGMLHVERVSNLLQAKDDSEAPPQNISIGMHLKSRVLGILSK